MIYQGDGGLPHNLINTKSQFLMENIIRKILDRLYFAAGFLSALCILSICLLVTRQVIFNLITKIFGTDFAFSIPSYAVFAGFYWAH